MSSQVPTSDKFWPLLDAACDGTLDETQFQELAICLNADPQVRKVFLDHVRLRSNIRFLHRAERACDQSFARIRAGFHTIPLGRSPAGFSSTSHPTLTYLSSGWPLAYFLATVIATIGLLVGAHTYVTQPGQVAIKSPARMVPAVDPSVESVGRITGMVDCKWNNAETAPTQNFRVSLGQKYALASGLMKITYDTGAEVILQGPVAYEVDSKNGGFLPVGKLTGKVEVKAAKGFSIRTPTATVTDLGTEFGVDVNPDGATEAHVFVGKVTVISTADKGQKKTEQIISAGKVARVVNNNVRVTATAMNEKRFVRVLPRETSPNHGDAYAELVLSMNPVVCYYRMDKWPKTDQSNRYVLVDSAPGGHHGTACFDQAFGRSVCEGKFGKALSFHGSMGSDYASVKNYPKAENGRLSVSAWVWHCSIDPWATIVGNWYCSPSYKDEIGQFGFGANGSLELSAQIHQQDGEIVRVCERGVPLPRSCWHHVAFVADGAVLHLYRNGVEVGEAPYRGIIRQPIPECLSIGCAMDKDGIRPRPENACPWNGWLDEIAIFNHALSPEQVRDLYTGQATKESRVGTAHQ
jgi:hypothetical protein